ncbi:hypothetical protein [Microvirga tunisiensis]|uniref:General stress protein CsbD n=1 Tax=Microvirga tunisiensis TaxID=2108360 RepID=A0A5N7MXI7_9HYPH|nr:hypothetical protein [Microvirga tunisiensis]MPR13843.1 hypothetical protein [Microvirga tunisiensis]MPR31673.1 hypothetical protein [Microvirga tunisiensis]
MPQIQDDHIFAGRNMREVQAKWDRLSMSDLAQIKTKAALIARVQEQYGLDREVAAQDVEIWNSDRHF